MANSQQPTSALPTNINPTIFNTFTSSVTTARCSQGIDLTVLPPGAPITRFSNGCYDTTAAGLQDADTRTDQGQSSLPQIASCTATNSLSVLLQGTPPTTSATVYLPQSSWRGEQVAGIATCQSNRLGTWAPRLCQLLRRSRRRNPVNSCTANSQTGQTVCTSNLTDVYLLSSTGALTTRTDGANAFVGSTSAGADGACETCGVTINQMTNEALITMGLHTSGSGTSFSTSPKSVLCAGTGIQRDLRGDAVGSRPQSDPSAGQSPPLAGNPPVNNGVYDLYNTSSMAATPEYANPIWMLPGGSVGKLRFRGRGLLRPGSLWRPRNWASCTSPICRRLPLPRAHPRGVGRRRSSSSPFPEFRGLACSGAGEGTEGMAVAPGSQLAIVTGSFGGNGVGAVQLPATKRSRTRRQALSTMSPPRFRPLQIATLGSRGCLRTP